MQSVLLGGDTVAPINPQPAAPFRSVYVTGETAAILLKPHHKQRKSRAEAQLKRGPLQRVLPGSPVFQARCWALLWAVVYSVSEGRFCYTRGTAAVLFALAAGAAVLFTNNTVGSKPTLLPCGFLRRCYLEVVSAPSAVVLFETPSFPAGEGGLSASNQQ